MAIYTSFRLISHIQEQLFSHEEKRLQETTKEIVRAARTILKGDIAGVIYEGIFYPNPDRTTPIQQSERKPPLPEQLEPRMVAHMADALKVATDRQTIWQAIYKLLENCDTVQDLRDALPACLEDVFPNELKNMPRVRPEMFTVQDDHRGLRLAEKALPLMQFYTAARLIY